MLINRDPIGIARFNGVREEFHIWKWQMNALLMYKKLLRVVNGFEIESTATDTEAWKDKEYNTYSLLCNSIEHTLLGTLVDCKIAKKVWNTLIATYEHNSSEGLHELQK